MARACLPLVLLLATAPGIASTPANLESAIKASFLLKFAPFVEWPPSALTPADKMFLICVAGEDPFGTILNDVARGQKMAQRPVGIRHLGPADSPTGCHILFAGRSTDTGYAPFGALAGQPVLTVSDGQSGPPGAMIHFVTQGGRVRFQIDEGTARASGLKISSKLLALAVAVDRK